MMKNLTKAALLLAAATAFLFAACSHSSGGSKDPTPETVSVTGVSALPEHVSIEEGQTAKITATVTPDDATDKTVFWESEDEEIATVTGNGDDTATVKGVKAGETTITVKTKDGGHEVKVPVTVYLEGTLVEVESVAITADKTTIKAGETATITAEIMPSGATDKSLTWKSSDTAVATVTGNEDGTATVTGKAAGSVTITATASNGVESNEITITVEANSEITPSVPHKNVIIDVSDLSTLADGGPLSTEANIKAVGALTVDSNSNKKSTFAGEGISPTKRLKLDSKISDKGLEVNLTGDATILVYAYSGSSGAARSLALYDADKQIIDGTTQGIGTGDDNILNVAVFKVKANTTYYIGAVDSGINIYYIAVLGTFTEESTETVAAKAATCTETGTLAHTLTDYGRYILADGTGVPSSRITTPVLGHDYTGVTPTQVTLPTENTEGKFTATCARKCGYTQDIVLPELTDPSYTRATGANGNYSYSYVDKTTGLTVTFETTKVEQGAEKRKYLIGFDSEIQDKNNYGVDGWEVSSQGYKNNANIIVDDVTYAKGVKLNSSGYVTIVINAEAKVTFYINGNQTLKYNETETDAATQYSEGVYTVTVKLSAGTYKVTRSGGSEIALACLVIEPTN